MTTMQQGGLEFAGDSRARGQDAGRSRRFAPPPASLQKLFDRLPPHSIEAEMSLLGSMILDPKVVGDVIQIVASPDAFYSETHASIFEALIKLYERHQSGDLVQLAETLRSGDILEDIGGPDYLLRLAESVPSASNAPHYARIVREKSQLRSLINAAGEILHEAYHTTASDDAAREVLDRAEQRIFDIADKSVGIDTQNLSAILHEILDTLDANLQHGRTITGVASGFFDLDEMTSGLQKGEMAIVAARPSMGKTAFALNLAEQIAFGGSPYDERGPKTPVGFFSMEMSRQAVAQRLLCAHSGIDSHKMRKNLLNHQDFDRLIKSCSALDSAPIFIDDTPGLTTLMLRAKARRMVAQHGVRCLIIDYLQLMSAPGAARESRQAEVSSISRNVKAIARELNIPVVCLAQLNRGAELREGHRPRMADLRESGSIEQDADVIMLLHREEYYHQSDPDWALDNPDKVGVAEVIIAKQRNGPTGTVDLSWDAKSTRFRNLAHGSYTSRPAVRDADPATQRTAEPPRPDEPRRAHFSPGSKSGPIANHRDGGGPDRDDWQNADVDDIPI